MTEWGGRARLGLQVLEGVYKLELVPFFLSKYEMTQAQWERFTGENPSYLKEGSPIAARPGSDRGFRVSPIHPVDQVSQLDCLRVLRRMDLTLPRIDQWEYAARAGTDTVWWTGDEPTTLQDAANIQDDDPNVRDKAATSSPTQWTWKDGWKLHAPVNIFHANPFGLHHVHGNVWEWCATISHRAPPGYVEMGRVLMGGSFMTQRRYQTAPH